MRFDFSNIDGLLDPLWLKGLIYVYLHLHNDYGKIKPHCVESPTRVYS